jgi:hypothetical protein
MNAFDSELPKQEEVEDRLELYKKLARMAGPDNQLIREKYLELAQLHVKSRQLKRAIMIYDAGMKSCQQAPELVDGLAVACREMKQATVSSEMEDEGGSSNLDAICQGIVP